MKKFLVLLAIFCILGSAAAVSATDMNDDFSVQDAGQYQGDVNGYDAGQDDGGYAGSQYQDDGGWAGSQYNESQEELTGRPIIDPDYAHMEPAAGAPVNETGNATDAVAQNDTANATSPHAMLPTGNPILALLAVGAVLGCAGVMTKKK